MRRATSRRPKSGAGGSAAEPPKEVRDREPPRRRAERQAQNLDSEQDRAANQVCRMRPSARARCRGSRRDNQRVGDQGRRSTLDGPRRAEAGPKAGPIPTFTANNTRAIAGASIEAVASNISRLWISGRDT